jgi:hypothetical protein
MEQESLRQPAGHFVIRLSLEAAHTLRVAFKLSVRLVCLRTHSVKRANIERPTLYDFSP